MVHRHNQHDFEVLIRTNIKNILPKKKNVLAGVSSSFSRGIDGNHYSTETQFQFLQPNMRSRTPFSLLVGLKNAELTIHSSQS